MASSQFTKDPEREMAHEEYKWVASEYKRRAREERREERKLFLTWAKEYWHFLAISLFALFSVILFWWAGRVWFADLCPEPLRRFFAPSFIRQYVFLIFIPALGASLLVTWSLYRTGYAGIAANLGRKKKRAAVALIVLDRKILLNLQTDWPWKGCWLLPGGYMRDRDTRDGRRDESPEATVLRRLWKLTNPGSTEEEYQPKANNYEVRKPVAKTHNSFVYVHTMFAHGHAPIPILVYTIKGRHKEPLSQQDFPTTDNDKLNWFSLDDIDINYQSGTTTGKKILIPPHIKELVIFALNPKRPKSILRSWELTEDGEEHFSS